MTRPTPPRRDAGFSLAETLVATAIAAFGLAGVAALIGTGVQLQNNARHSSMAVNLAVAELERLRMLPTASAERSNGGSLTANQTSHFAVRGTPATGTTTIRWVVADGPACGVVGWGGPGAPVECTKTITVRALPNTALAGSATIQGLLWR